MVNRKAIARHEANNAWAAAYVLANRTSQPLCLIRWAEVFQCRQRDERAQDGQPGHLVPSRATTAAQPQQPAKAVTTATTTQHQLPLAGVIHGAA